MFEFLKKSDLLSNGVEIKLQNRFLKTKKNMEMCQYFL